MTRHTDLPRVICRHTYHPDWCALAVRFAPWIVALFFLVTITDALTFSPIVHTRMIFLEARVEKLELLLLKGGKL